MNAMLSHAVATTSHQEARYGWQKSPAQGKEEAQESQGRQELRASCSPLAALSGERRLRQRPIASWLLAIVRGRALYP